MSSDPNPQEGQVYGFDVPGGGGGGGEKIDRDAMPEQDSQIVRNPNSNQLMLLFQGEVYVLESVTPEKGTLRCPSKVLKFNSSNPANPNEHAESINSELGGNNNALHNNSDNHDFVVTAAEISTGGITLDVQLEMEEDLKAEL